MKKSLIIFGTSQIAEMAHYYFTQEDSYDVKGFTCDGEYIKEESFLDLPIYPFEDLSNKCPPNSYELFIAISYNKLNMIREEKYNAAKSMGFSLASYISKKAYIAHNVSIGENAFILEDNTIQAFASIGNNVFLWSGNHIGHHSKIMDHTFVSSHVVISGGVKIGSNCFIGVNSTIRDHIVIEDRNIIGAGSLILENCAEGGLYTTSASLRSKVPSSRIRNL
jgi:sugar O-acyltransferase (sialic acid O-acetyltransferase NeuD family)